MKAVLRTILLAGALVWPGVLAHAGQNPKVSVTELPAMSAPDARHPYEQVRKVLTGARATGNVRLYQIGSSTSGRPIHLAALCPTTSRSLPKVRIMIVCSQHGDEPAGPLAAARLIGHCSRRLDPAILADESAARSISARALSSVLWLIVPDANPDGMVNGTRTNARGIDLNRDWTKRSQPESRAIKRAFDRWQPQIVIDLHQWSPDDPPPAENGLELPIAAGPASGQLTQRDLAISSLGALGGRLGPVALVTSSPGANPTLAHRYFARRGAISYLIETAAGATLQERTDLLQSLLVVMSSKAGASREVAELYGGAEVLPREFALWFERSFGGKRQAPGAKAFWDWMALGMACLLLALVRQTAPRAPEEAERRPLIHRHVRRRSVLELPEDVSIVLVSRRPMSKPGTKTGRIRPEAAGPVFR